MISVKNLTKSFGSRTALKNISFEIGQGEIVGFLGQNGAGKTTLMRILTTYLAPSSGEAAVGGYDVTKNPLDVRRKIGYLPETPPLYTSMMVQDYLRFAAQLKEVPAKHQTSQIKKVLEECHLRDVRNQLIGTLSKGYRQRVGLAQAIINSPEILILDEPTSGLDPVQIIQVRNLIKNLEQKRTVILSTHILSEIEQIAQRVLILGHGQIIADDSLANLCRQGENLEQVFLRLVGYNE